MNQLDSRFEIKEVTPTGSFAGYGNVYGVKDFGDDIVSHGAFADSLSTMAQKGQMPAMLWQHKAAEPIGVYQSVKEDGQGLHVEGKLALKTARGAEAYELLQMKALSGLSIGFETKDATYDQKSGVRTINKGDLWEVSLVTFPMNDAARVSMVKGLDGLRDIGEAECFLRDVGGLSRSEAKRFISIIKGLPQRDADEKLEEVKHAALAEAMKRFRRIS
jgi:HK97 family phage prohead protease